MLNLIEVPVGNVSKKFPKMNSGLESCSMTIITQQVTGIMSSVSILNPDTKF